MPSPFPGMDPYLEKRTLWPDFHQRLITYISEQLQPQIRPRYNARIEERIHLIHPPQDYYPDVSIIRRPRQEPRTSATSTPAIADEPYLIKVLETEFREPYIEIVYLPTGDVVTTIELLSPINKTGEGWQRYRQKQHQLLNSTTSLVEIDLLRFGEHTVAVPEQRMRGVTRWRYLVSVHRTGQYGEFEVYFIPLNARLPRCRIPLRMPDADAVLDLPAVFNRTYEVSGYEDFIDYNELPPGPPLSDEEIDWLDALLQEKGVRTAKRTT